MDSVVNDILQALRETDKLTPTELDRIVRRHSKRAHDGRRRFAKKHILAHYLEVRAHDAQKFASWNVTDELDGLFVQTMKMKPRRTASGVATITVITKPWPCAGTCLYCPNDVRMPKSYLHDEPACQRAERNCFDPYLQVASRLAALEHMGHATDKIELIVLGGTWTDYPEPYQTWFACSLFAALNDDEQARERECARRRSLYEQAGITSDPEAIARKTGSAQDRVNRGLSTYNDSFESVYARNEGWMKASSWQKAAFEEVERQHRENEDAKHRVVGLVVETRPDCLTPASLRSLRRLGCTKIQMGIQSLDDEIVNLNGRKATEETVARAFELCRLFGFKTHAHFMLNLYGSTPSRDKADYLKLVGDPRFLPDEVKLYPCALVEGTGLTEKYRSGAWRPYSEDELLDVLCADMLATPSYTRVSRMIRDISAKDILVGNKKTNLRQLVERKLSLQPKAVREIRFREPGTEPVDLASLAIDDIAYTTGATVEHFLQWVTPEGGIVGFLRLSLPSGEALARHGLDSLPIHAGEAMIREVHVYGFAAKLTGSAEAAQHHGLGKALVQRACILAKEASFTHINVISAVGTRNYYRNLGFEDCGLYQRKPLL